jgi:hypothetical protein
MFALEQKNVEGGVNNLFGLVQTFSANIGRVMKPVVGTMFVFALA